MTRWLRIRWRLDRLAAAGLAVVSAPLIAVVAAAVRLADGSPVLVRLPRVGVGGTWFSMTKFRTMTAESEDGAAGGSPLTFASDPRVTRLGPWLRDRRLDELPQLVNVVRGQMCLLGPRPETPGYVDLDDERWRRVLTAVPGIAGPAQVVVHDVEAGMGVDDLGRYEAEMLPVKLAIDEWYLEHASPALDFLVVRALVERFLLGRRCTSLHSRIAREVPLAAAMMDQWRSLFEPRREVVRRA